MISVSFPLFVQNEAIGSNHIDDGEPQFDREIRCSGKRVLPPFFSRFEFVVRIRFEREVDNRALISVGEDRRREDKRGAGRSGLFLECPFAQKEA